MKTKPTGDPEKLIRDLSKALEQNGLRLDPTRGKLEAIDSGPDTILKITLFCELIVEMPSIQ